MNPHNTNQLSAELSAQPNAQSPNAQSPNAQSPNTVSIIDRMKQAINLHNINAKNSDGTTGVAYRSEMKLSTPVEKVFLPAKARRVSSIDEILNRSIKLIPLENVIEQSKKNNTTINIDNTKFLDSLPRANRDKNEFLINIITDNGHAIFCVRELPWPLSVAIDADSYRNNDDDQVYFASEIAQRETLREAIVWVADLDSQLLLKNEDAGFLNSINYDALSSLWNIYEKEITLSPQEEKDLYKIAHQYFSCDGDGVGLHPMIFEVDLLFKIGGLSKSDIRSYTKREYDIFKIIERARHDAVNTPTAQEVMNFNHLGAAQNNLDEMSFLGSETSNSKNVESQNLIGFFPPGIDSSLYLK